MEKKNTILLTTIAVATLLITVVGATFAYFGVTLQNDSETVSISGKATDVGIVTVETPVTEMHLNLTGTEMAYDNQGKVYLATNDSNKSYQFIDLNAGNVGHDEIVIPDDAKYEIFKISVLGGDPTVDYMCIVDGAFYKTENDTMVEFVDEDAAIELYLKYDYDSSISTDNLESSRRIYLEKTKFTNNKLDNFSIGELPELKAGSTLSIEAAVWIINNNAEQKLANTKLDLEYRVNSITCKIKGE